MKRKRTAQPTFFNLCTGICLGIICSMSMAVSADIITVTNTNDSGSGSLRQALVDANDGDTINFSVTGTIGLTSGELLVNKSITISGPGAEILGVNGNATYRVFHIAPGKTVAISDLTITNGNANEQPVPDGGGIYNDHATLTLTDCTISNNSAFRDAGGIYNGHAMLTLTNCTISGNLTGNDGGGVNNDASFGSSATLQISNTVIINNSAYHGGGVCNDARLGEIAMLQISNSTLSNNHAGYDAGAVLSVGEFGHATAMFSNCTISGNSAQAYGGGINCTVTDIPLGPKDHLNRKTWPTTQRYTGNPSVTIVNVTISGNAAGTIGGGIYDHALVGIANTTFSGNSAVSGGAIYHDGGMPPLVVEISDTVLNAGASGENIFNNGGTVTSHGYNLSSDDGGGYLNGPGDQVNTNPVLGPLQDNGGLTFTHALSPGSPGIDAGDPNFTPPPFYDQRGADYDRVKNGRLDVGSFEVQEPLFTPTPTATATPTPTAASTATPTVSATATATTTAIPTVTPTATPTSTPRPSPSPRPAITPRPRPTPPPHP